MSSSQQNFKLVLLGEGRVGKTSLAARYVNGSFNDGQQPTIQASYMSKTLMIDGCQVVLNLWDTAGQERFHALGPIYYRDAHAALLVFCITDADSFQRVKNWVKELKIMVGPDIVLTMVANKQDLERQRVVPTEESRAFAASIGAAHFETSAKTGDNIDQTFADTARRVLACQRARQAAPAASHNQVLLAAQSHRQGPALTLDEQARPTSKASCC